MLNPRFWTKIVSILALLTLQTLAKSLSPSQSAMGSVLLSGAGAAFINSGGVTLKTSTKLPPYINEPPLGRTVAAGGTTTFLVLASGPGTLKYQWQFNEQNIPGATSTTLRLLGVTPAQAGRYRVLVSSEYGVTTSTAAILTVNLVPPSINEQPLSRTVRERETVVFSVLASGNGTIRYQWQLNGQDISGATSATLRLTEVKTNQAGLYRVVVSSEYGSTLSQNATLKVTPIPAPTIGDQPSSKTVQQGETVLLAVTASGLGTIQYQWQFNEQDIAGATASFIRLSDIKPNQAGRYRVLVRSEYGVSTSDTAILTIVSISAPKISAQPAGQSVQEGGSVTFSVTASGQGTLKYQWQFNDKDITGATSSFLRLTGVKPTQAGAYRVLVSSEFGSVTSEVATLAVVAVPPPTITTQPVGRTVREGDTVSLWVEASGQGTIKYQWQFNEQDLVGATSATLKVVGVKANQSGRYRVLVSSEYGVTTSAVANLVITTDFPPTIVEQPSGTTVKEGVDVVFSVSATSASPITYQWQWNEKNIPGATSNTLVLKAVRSTASGRYRVIVGNAHGSVTSSDAGLMVLISDVDGDGLSDLEERLLGTNPDRADTDGDGLGDFEEVRTHLSNPLMSDTDGDGYNDGVEVASKTDPNNKDNIPNGSLAIFPAIDVEFFTVQSVKYQLESSNDMEKWTAQGGVVVGNGTNQNHLVRVSQAGSFWRLRAIQ